MRLFLLLLLCFLPEYAQSGQCQCGLMKKPSSKTAIKTGFGNELGAKFLGGLTGSPDGDRLYVAANEGGLLISRDHGKTFMSTTLGAYKNSQANFVKSVFTPAIGERIYAVTSRNGLQVSIDGGNIWVKADLESDNLTAVHGHSNGQLICVGSTDGLFISQDGGQSFSHHTTKNGLLDNHVTSVNVSDNFYIFAGTTKGLSISRNGGANWTTVKARKNPFDLPDDYIQSVFTTTKGGDLNIYVGTAKGLSMSSDSGRSFITKNGGTDSKSAYITSIFANQNGKNVFAIGLDNYLSISKCHGQSFGSMQPSKNPAINLRAVFATKDESILVLTTRGVLKSTNGGITWESILEFKP